jgi:hypothetical protein
MRTILITINLLLLGLVFLGCGGGSKFARPGSGNAGVKITVNWPDGTRLIPAACTSIKIELSDNNGLVCDPQVLNKPESGATSTALFSNLPVEMLTVTATAYPTAGAQGTPQATGQTAVTTIAGEQATVTLEMFSTITRLDVTPPTRVVAVGNTIPLRVLPRTSSSDIVLIPNNGVIWSSSDPTIAAIDANTGVVTGIKEGTVQITATERETGISVTVDLTVNLNVGGIITWATGPINGVVTWSGTVHLTGDVTVGELTSLTIQPGTKIIADPFSDDQVGGVHSSRIEIIVNGGTLIANGTADAPILFTSAGVNPSRGDWYGIRLNRGIMEMANCVQEYGKEGYRLEGGSLTMSDCAFRQNDNIGMHAFVGNTWDKLTLNDNGQFGLYVEPDQSSTISNSTIARNGSSWWYSGGLIQQRGSLTVNNCQVTSNHQGVMACGGTINCTDTISTDNSWIGFSGKNVTLTRCKSKRNGQFGIYMYYAYNDWDNYWGAMDNGAGFGGTVTDSEIANNGSWAIYRTSSWGGWYTINMTNTLVTKNGGGLYGAESWGWDGGETNYILDNCEVSYNSNYGVGGRSSSITKSKILWNQGNGINRYVAAISDSVIDSNNGNGISDCHAVTNCKITNNAATGVGISGVADPGFTGNLIAANNIGVWFNSNNTLEVISGNDIFSNRQYEIYNNGTAALKVTGSYFGEPTTTELTSHISLTKIFDSHDDAGKGQVAIPDWQNARVTPLQYP